MFVTVWMFVNTITAEQLEISSPKFQDIILHGMVEWRPSSKMAIVGCEGGAKTYLKAE